MGQMGFFDVENRYATLDAKHDPLAKINAVVPWDATVMFKAIILCALYNLSDDQVEYQMRDRPSFVRFLGLALKDKVPDAKTAWLYREQLSHACLIEALFEDFDACRAWQQ